MPALWIGLAEAASYFGLLAYFVNAIKTALGD
jgi:hypothetical protein